MRLSGVRWVLLCLLPFGCDLTRFEAAQCPVADEDRGPDDEAQADSACSDAAAGADEGPSIATGTEDAAGPQSSEPADGDEPTEPDTTGDETTPTVEPGTDAGDQDAGSDEPDTTLPGIECDTPSPDHVRAYFEVPGAKGADDGDYFRLPFPNDFYLNRGQVSLGDFPAATEAARGFVAAVNQSSDGFSSSPTVLFRFSGKVNFKDSVIPRLHVLDITDPLDTHSPPLKLLYSPQGGNYICHDWLAVRTAAGHPLLPGHTYTAWLEQGVSAANGLEVEGADHFRAMLADATPSDPVLATLHGKYEPLRVYLATTSTDPDLLLNATVFTVGNLRAPMQQLAAQVQGVAAPAIELWVKCADGVASPCADVSGGRACGAGTSSYEEYHALIALPIFQRGQAPYLAQGGDVDTHALVRTENVCLSLTVPTDSPPAAGYAVAVVAHGVGGSFKSHVRPEVAGLLSTAQTPSGVPQPFAVLGYDAVQHGPRRGDLSDLRSDDLDALLVNFDNPLGTLGTSLQGGADVLSVIRAARELSLPSEVSGRDDVVFSTDRVVFWGQGEGAQQGAIALSYSDDVRAAVFSGLSAGFVQTQIRRQQPASLRQALGAAIGDPGKDAELVFGGEYNPALGLLQQLLDAADPINHAALLVSTEQSDPLHVFQVYGTQDSVTASVGQQSFAIAADLAVVQADDSAAPADDLGSEQAMFPLSGNVVLGDVGFTAGIRQYGPPTETDGHLVAYAVPSAALDIAGFLALAAGGETPQIGH